MTNEEKKELLTAIEGKDIAEILSLLIISGNQYSRRTLKFFRWFCKWTPLFMMLMHWAAMWDFANNRFDMFETHGDNWVSYAFTYFMLYILPMVIILASRFFYLCWRYRIPFFYFFGVNAIHIAYWSWYTTNDMAMAHKCLMIMVAGFYLYGFLDDFCNKTRLGRKLFS